MNQRIEQLFSRLPEQIDAALITADVNRFYFTGMRSSAGTVLLFRDAAYLIIDFRYIERARQIVKSCTVLEQGRLYEQVRTLLQKHHARQIALEAGEMTLQQYHNICHALHEYEFDTTNELTQAIYACRTVKTPEEIEQIRTAQRIAETAFTDICSYIRPGISERQIMLRLNQVMLENGSEGESFPTIVLTGTATSMPHGEPSAERIVQKGDFVLMDYGAIVGGYHSDMTRTICVGQPSELMQEIYALVYQAQEAAIQSVKPGISGNTLDQIAREIISDAGYGDAFGHALGHGVGLEIHEYPVASQASKEILEPGNVVTVEPGIYLPGKFGVRIEDFVAVTEKGCENLTRAEKSPLICL